ncbi:ethanolamine ammonia-lyase small subunit [Caulobacter ginsengisoli]|uniref:Ethanolamine ammonia-lyase small subunit n=1 Tax=Caulobacter ginsengisoli TaxID=400775 RepID=A0ABU0IMM5_9CAUL|nr:ethanolamine ammonia-lyase subunit EutC [Caulobacter ginsengisoli]MDQ0463252.1 ethanolamine ammonia-lyase small subunit [Caulobacter ginsengisoli]
MKPPVTRDPWAELRARTPARIALGRAGPALPTKAVLDFALDHARARDAVHAAVDWDALAGQLALPTVRVASAAPDRATYLRRPDLGRKLAEGERLRPAPQDFLLVIADGLSAAAVQAHAAPLIAALPADLRTGPVVLASQARVALGDEIGERMGARMVAVLIGERPGLSSPDSLGVYLTYEPRVGRTDAERNCISNIRPQGLGYEAAAARLTWLVREALKRRLTGVELKDQSDLGLIGPLAHRAVP